MINKIKKLQVGLLMGCCFMQALAFTPQSNRPEISIAEIERLDIEDIGTVLYGKVANNTAFLQRIAIICFDDRIQGSNFGIIYIKPNSLEVFWIVVRPNSNLVTLGLATHILSMNYPCRFNMTKDGIRIDIR